MKAKLIKDEVGFNLCVPNGSTNEFIASTDGMYVKHKLSLKNCQAIENGYDLDELAEEWVFETNEHKWSNNDDTAGDNYGSFKAGFQKALEILGDKKFSEDEAYKIWKAGQEYWKTSGESITFEELIERRNELLQQTEWDVEIKMRSKNIDELRESGEGFLNNKNLHVMELDEAGCLILKKL